MDEKNKIVCLFRQKTGIEVRNEKLLIQALTHKSHSNSFHNERMEYLGDSILSFLTSDYLYSKNKDSAEGDLTKIKSEIVNKENLAHIFDVLKLDDILFIDRKSFKQEIPKSIKENVVEALLAALYLDGGLKKAKSFHKLILKHRGKMADTFYAKNELQEFILKKYKTYPEFTVKESPKGFLCEVIINGVSMADASAKTKKECEKKVAYAAYKKLKRSDGENSGVC